MIELTVAAIVIAALVLAMMAAAIIWFFRKRSMGPTVRVVHIDPHRHDRAYPYGASYAPTYVSTPTNYSGGSPVYAAAPSDAGDVTVHDNSNYQNNNNNAGSQSPTYVVYQPVPGTSSYTGGSSAHVAVHDNGNYQNNNNTGAGGNNNNQNNNNNDNTAGGGRTVKLTSTLGSTD